MLASLTCTDTTTMAANTTANFTFVVKVNNQRRNWNNHHADGFCGIDYSRSKQRKQ